MNLVLPHPFRAFKSGYSRRIFPIGELIVYMRALFPVEELFYASNATSGIEKVLEE